MFVTMTVGVGVETGNIKVIAGKGTRVVVAVFDGMIVGEDVRVGKLGGLGGVGVTVVATRYDTTAYTGVLAVIVSKYNNRRQIVTRMMFIARLLWFIIGANAMIFYQTNGLNLSILSPNFSCLIPNPTL